MNSLGRTRSCRTRQFFWGGARPPKEVAALVAAHRHHGVVPICRVLQVALSAVRSAMSQPVCARRLTDDAVKPLLLEVFNANYRVYGRSKMKAALRREHGINFDKDRIARLMAELDIRGVTRTKSTVTTRSDRSSPRAPDLVNRQFKASRPNKLWVCDFTYVPPVVRVRVHGVRHRRFLTHDRWVAHRVVDDRRSGDRRVEMAIFSRRHQFVRGVIAHSDAGSQYVSVAYTERLAEIHARPSIGSIGDSYDNALAESVNGLYKTELIRRQGPWRHAEHVELATLTYVDWFNQRRLHGELNDIPPA